MLQGHKSEVYTAKFSPNGAELASGSFDKTIRTQIHHVKLIF